MTTAKVTVLMPVYNAERHLREAVGSILSQTYADFTFLVIDDGSTDGSAAIIRSYSDPRLHLVQNSRNMGLTATLNLGLEMAQGEYIARMDADDVSLPERLAKQVAFLDTHPEVGIVGVWAEAFGEARFRIPHPPDAETIRAKLLFDSALVHPAVLMRQKFLDAHSLRYLPLGHFEDYELWQRAVRLFPLANIPEILFRYRVSGGSAFFGASEDAQHEVYAALDRKSLPLLGIDPTPADLALHTYLRRPGGDRRNDAERWLLRLADANRARDTTTRRLSPPCSMSAGWSPATRHPAHRPLAGSAMFGPHSPAGQVCSPTMYVRMLGKFLLQRLR